MIKTGQHESIVCSICQGIKEIEIIEIIQYLPRVCQHTEKDYIQTIEARDKTIEELEEKIEELESV